MTIRQLHDKQCYDADMRQASQKKDVPAAAEAAQCRILKQQVTAMVYDALVVVCGRELRTGPPGNSSPPPQSGDGYSGGTTTTTAVVCDGCGSAVEQRILVLQWRAQLRRLVDATVTCRTPGRVLAGAGAGAGGAAGGGAAEASSSSASRSKLYDVEIRTVTALFQRYRSGSRSGGRRSATSENAAAACSLTVVSDLGVARRVHSAYELAAQLLQPVMEDMCRAQQLSNHVRVAAPSGFVHLVTPQLMQCILRTTTLHLSPCPQCPAWCKGSKGLWWHLQQQHGAPHGAATATATYQRDRDGTALVVFRPPPPPPAVDPHSTTSNTTVIGSTHPSPLSTPPPLPLPALTRIDDIVGGDQSDPWSCVHRGSLSDLQRYVAAHPHFDGATARDRHGALLLHWAAGGGHLDMVRYLVHAACPGSGGHDRHDYLDTPQRGKRAFAGRTALHWAARHGHVPVVRYLLDDVSNDDKDDDIGDDDAAPLDPGGASRTTALRRRRRRLEAETADGTTAFGWAAWQGHVGVLQLLHAANCRIDVTNQFGCTAVLWAAQGPHGDARRTLEWLHGVGCSLNVINHAGHGILHKAAQRGNRDVCEWFLQRTLAAAEAEAAPLVGWKDDDDDGGASDSAVRARHPASLRALAGPDNDGCRPSDLARAEGHGALAADLVEHEATLVRLCAGVPSPAPAHPHKDRPKNAGVQQ